MSIDYNNLEGGIPTEIETLGNLSQLRLGGNRYLGSTIPSEIGTLTNLEVLLLGVCFGVVA
jgi:hypothetical protein